MASTSGHSLVEQIRLLQLSAATSLVDVVEKFKQLRGWQGNEDFAIEAEVNKAVAADLRDRGCSLSDKDAAPKAIIGKDGKAIYSFDGMLLSISPDGTATLFVGEVKHHLTADDVRLAARKMRRLRKRLSNLQDGSIGSEGAGGGGGVNLYVPQLQFFKSLMDRCGLHPGSVQLFVGGTRIDEDAVKEAAAGNCIIVAPSGGRFGVVAPAEVAVEKVAEEDEEV